jgi:type VI protein secretion system component VasF
MNKEYDHNNDASLLNQVVDVLDQSIEHLDGRTLSRLNQARNHALATPARPRLINAAWLKAGALAVIILGLINGWMMFTTSELQSLTTDDFELIMVNDDFELMRDLDFFAWMIEQERGG